MKACIVKPHRGGLFSLINNVITCMGLYDHVHVDWSEGCMYGGHCDGNIWNHLFEPTDPVTGIHKVIYDYPNQLLTYRNPAKLYPYSQWRHFYHELWRKKIHVRDPILNAVDNFIGFRKLGDYISVLVRAHSHAGEQPTEKSQSLDAYAAAIEAAGSPAKPVFLMAGDHETVEWFKARFPVVYFEDTPRSDTRDDDRHLLVSQTVWDAKRVLTEALVASQGETLIHPVSNISTACLYINPNLRSVYLP